MGARSREVSLEGAYHVDVRAHSGEYMFEEPVVAAEFIKDMVRATSESNVTVVAYCIMSNHVHMLLEGEVEQVSRVFKVIGATFCRWWNNRTGHEGAVFASRHYTKAIDTEEQYKNTLAYIFNNPVRQGMVARAEDYAWSNYSAVENENYENAEHKVLKNRIPLEELRERVAKATKKYDEELDSMKPTRITDRCIIEDVTENFPEHDPYNVEVTPAELQEKIVLYLFNVHDRHTNCHQIARMTGIKYHKVRKIRSKQLQVEVVD